MRTIPVQPLTYEGFSKYGAYQNMLEPKGESLGAAPAEFFRDLLQLRLGGSSILSVSVLELTERPLLVDAMEYHNDCCEGMMPMDTDVIVQLAPAVKGDVIPLEKVEAFFVPKGTLIVLNPGVWHESPYVAGQKKGHIFCMLPERTYMKDAFLIPIPQDQRISIQISK